MMTVKVGQIYTIPEYYSLRNQLACVTYACEYTVDLVCDDGRVHTFAADYVEDRRIIAEYPTWQEAVNSKEFNNE